MIQLYYASVISEYVFYTFSVNIVPFY